MTRNKNNRSVGSSPIIRRESIVTIANLPKNRMSWLSLLIAALSLILSGWQTYTNFEEQKAEKAISQASDISCWFNDEEQALLCTLTNSSESSVYDVVITPVFIQGAGSSDGKKVRKEIPDIPTATLYQLPPGKFVVSLMNPLEYGMGIRYGLEIAFKDSSGQSWVRKCNGKLIKIRDSFEYYNLTPPISYGELLPSGTTVSEDK